MNKKITLQTITITLLLLIGVSSDVLALPSAAISTPQTTRFYVWASTGPLSYLSDARITIRDAKGKLLAIGKTNHRGMAGFKLRNKKLRELPLNIASSGGKVNDVKFRSQLKARAHEVGGNTPIIYLDLISTTARQITGPRMNYQQATVAVRNTLKIYKRAAVDTLRIKNPYVDGDRLDHAVLLAGGYTRFMKRLGRLARLGETMNGLEPPEPTIKTRGQSPAASILNAALESDQAPQSFEPIATTQTNTSTLCTTSTPSDGNTVANYGAIATASLLEVAGLPLAATDGVTGMLLSSVGLNDSSPTTAALNNIATELDCISTQLGYINDQLNEIEDLIQNVTLQNDLSNANTCMTKVQTQWSYYTSLVNCAIPGDKSYTCSTTPADNEINSSNPDLCTPTGSGGSVCGSGDIYNWNAVVTDCGTSINDALFGTEGAGGNSAWAELNIMTQSQYAWYTQTQVQALQSWLSYWGTYMYEQSVLQNEVFNYYGQWGNAITASGAPGNGSSACAYGTGISGSGTDEGSNSISACQWQSNVQFAFPGNLYSDEIGLWNGTAINAYPAGLTLGTSPSTTAFNSLYLANAFYTEGNWSYPASTIASTAMTAFNAQGINPAGNSAAIETYDSPQALRTITPTSSQVSSLSSPQTSGGLTASNFFFGAINQINGWPTSEGWSANMFGYYTSDNTTTTSVNWESGWADVTMYMNGFIPASPDTNYFECGVGGSEVCFAVNSSFWDETGQSWPVMAVLLGRNYWASAENATNTDFYNVLPPPLTVPNAPSLISLTAGTGTIVVAFNATPSSEDGGMPITGYLASCTEVNTSTPAPITASGTASPISVIGLAGGTSYTCSVQAQNAGGLSVIPSCQIESCSATPTDSTTPSAPLALTAAPGYLQISLAFSPPSNTGGAVITGYQANCTSSSGGASSGQVTGAGSPLVVTGLTGGAEYSCSVVAQNVNGDGAAATVTASPLSPVAPGAPTLTSIYNADISGIAEILLDFNTPSSTGGVALTQYTGTCTSTNASPSISFTGTVTAPANQLGLVGPSGSGSYTFSCTVQATNSAGLISPASNALSAAPNSGNAN